MSKRTDTIRSLFTQKVAEPSVDLAVDPAAAPVLSADNIAPERLVSGAVRSLKDSFSGIERENEELRAQIAGGETIVEVAPDLIDPSPVSDRFLEKDDTSFATLKASIAERGQDAPVLLRKHPDAPGRYQSAYGHRRIRAARELGLPVRAMVRHLSDAELVVAQGVENSAREDLTFIERATFAARLEARGHDRALVQQALSIDRAEASKLIAVARAVPPELVMAVGRAPKIGRGRWQALAAACNTPAALKRVLAVVGQDGFSRLASDERFAVVMAAASSREPGKAPLRGKEDAASRVFTRQGTLIARATRKGRALTLALEAKVDPAFNDYLVANLPELLDAFERARRDDKSRSTTNREH